MTTAGEEVHGQLIEGKFLLEEDTQIMVDQLSTGTGLQRVRPRDKRWPRHSDAMRSEMWIALNFHSDESFSSLRKGFLPIFVMWPTRSLHQHQQGRSILVDTREGKIDYEKEISAQQTGEQLTSTYDTKRVHIDYSLVRSLGQSSCLHVPSKLIRETCHRVEWKLISWGKSFPTVDWARRHSIALGPSSNQQRHCSHAHVFVTWFIQGFSSFSFVRRLNRR